SGFSNCWYENHHPDGSDPTTDPPALQTLHGQSVCGTSPPTGADSGNLSAQVGCDSRVLPCPPGASYPAPGHVVLHALPHEPTMPDPCSGVPANPWCPRAP